MIIYCLLFSINWFYFSFSIERIYLDLALFSTFFSREVLASNQIYTGKCPHMYFLLILKDYRAIFHLEKTDLQVLFSRLSLSFTCTAFKCNSVNSPPIICTIFIAFMLVNSPRGELVVNLFKPFPRFLFCETGSGIYVYLQSICMKIYFCLQMDYQ